MKKTFKYRLFPNKLQTTKLVQTLNSCRFVYNNFLSERKSSWEKDKKSISQFDQNNSLPRLKSEHTFLQNVHSQALQDVSKRIDLAFKAFFRRTKSGDDEPGYPRFKGKYRYDSFTYTQSGFKLLKNVVRLSKIGGVKIKYHRPVEGTIKTCTVRRSFTGKWYVTFSCVLEDNSTKQPIKPAIGVDMGLESFAILSDSTKVQNPRFFRKEEKSLKKVQKKFSKQKKGSTARRKVRKALSRVHERIRWKRENFTHQTARQIVNKFNTIVIEDLDVKDMQKNNFKGMNKSIQDAAWTQFLEFLSFKAEEAGKTVIRINPAYTSQTCSNCGTRQKLKLSDRIYNCNNCNLSLDRDVNAATNILALGMQGLVH